MENTIYSRVVPVVSLVVHRQFIEIDDVPNVLFVKYRSASEDELFVMPYELVRNNEQPYNCGVRTVNSLFDLGSFRLKLRNYYCDRVAWDDDSAMVAYYLFKIGGSERDILDYKLSNELDSLKICEFKWVPVTEESLDNNIFDPKNHYCWEVIRQSVASNYGFRIRWKGK